MHSCAFTFIFYDVFNHPEIGKNDPMHYMMRRRTDNLIHISKQPIQQPIWAPYGAHMVLQHKILHPKIVVKIINLTIESVKRVFTLAKTCMETISNSVHFVRSLKIIITCVFQRILTLKVMLLIIFIISKIFGKFLLHLLQVFGHGANHTLLLISLCWAQDPRSSRNVFGIAVIEGKDVTEVKNVVLENLFQHFEAVIGMKIRSDDNELDLDKIEPSNFAPATF